jgi:Tim10/DDP family zinc finger
MEKTFTDKSEAQLRVSYLKNIQKQCTKICNKDYQTQTLNPGEMNCIDRCVAKYFSVGEYIGKLYHAEKIKALSATQS